MSYALDVDALLLLATAMAAKRRPAGPDEIVAALDLIQAFAPGEDRLSEAFARLGRQGLLCAAGDGVALTPAAEKLVEGLSRKADAAGRQAELKGLLAAWKPVAEGVAVGISLETLRAALLAHRAALAAGGKNLLVPKPKPEAGKARPGQRQRKPMPKSRQR